MSPRISIGALTLGWLLTVTALFGSAPNFGPNVVIFDPTMSASAIQVQVDKVFNLQQSNQFGSSRYALLFKPGSYAVNLQVGFYTQVLGLGQSPDDTTLTGFVQVNAAWNTSGSNANATENFWRGAENLAVVPTGGTDEWAVSQACPMRRVHIKGNLVLDDNGGWSSGGFLSDSLIDGQVESGSQQQWLTRNSQMGSWVGSNWNMVFVGVDGAPAGYFPAPPYMVVNETPVVREKPFLAVDGSGNYSVFVPSLRRNSHGITWANGPAPGTSLPIGQFYIAQAGTDTAETINAALGQGLNLLLTPGIYALDQSINVTRPGTVVLGLGLATLMPENGVTAMSVSDVDGVILAGILFDAGTTSSAVLLQVGPPGSSADHSSDPSSLHDLFFRIGGAAVGQAALSLQINSSEVIGDDFWIWRADHGSGVGWTSNTANNGLIVNGQNVTVYGLAVEHFQQYQTQWNGNGGQVYFYQSEAPYDVPSDTDWMDGSVDGYASYKVANSVTSHQAYGLGIYCFFDDNSAVTLANAIEAPSTPNVQFFDMTTVSLGGVGQITSVINGTGPSANSSANVATLVQYPSTATTYIAGPSSITNAIGTASFSGSVQNASGEQTYQWQVSTDGGKTWTNTTDGPTYSGSTSATLNIAGVSWNLNGNQYRLVANPGPTALVSSAATLTTSVPTFATPPEGQTVNSGSTFVLTAVATDAASYQWTLTQNGSSRVLTDSPAGATVDAISGSSGPQLVITGATPASAGSYTVVATNPIGPSAPIAPAVISVVTASDPGRLINLSARAFVGTGSNVLIAGYVIEGAGELPVLLRSSGPALTAQNVTGVLGDPQLQLYSGSAVVDRNAGWDGNAQIASIANAVGATPWSNPSSKDSALLENQDPGPFTGITSGVSGDTGVALSEVYDATPSGTLSSSRLANIAARAFVGTGGNVLIAGFVIGGSTSKTVLIRASGPAISSLVSGTLGDPQLQLYSGSTLLGSTSAWAGNSLITAAAKNVGASPWTDPSSHDSALLVTLPPGGYTAIVSGVSGDTGVALVEIYDVP